MYKQISLFQNDDGFTVNLSLANTRTPRKNTTFHKVATAKLAQNESSLFTQLRTISSKSHAQMMSKRLHGMNINATYTATDNQHLFILDEKTSFIFVVDMCERTVSFLKVSDRIFVRGHHDPLYREFCTEIAKQTKPESYFNPCPLKLTKRNNENIVKTDPNTALLARIEEQDALISQLYAELEITKSVSAEIALELLVQSKIEEPHAECMENKEVNSPQKIIDEKISSLAVNYNRELLKTIKPLIKSNHIVNLEMVVQLLDKGMRLLPNRFTLDKIQAHYPLMFDENNYLNTVQLIESEQRRLASDALKSKDWSKEESQFEMLNG
ncbi:hypothetical protein ACIJC2_003387 [Vibrio parahaemolyticus]